MEELAAGMATRNQDAVGQMLDAFLQKLHGGTGDQMREMTERLATLGEGLQDLRGGLHDTATRMSEFADLMARRMGEGAEEALSRMTQQMGGLLQTLHQVAEQTRDAGANAGRDMAARIEAASAGFEASADRFRRAGAISSKHGRHAGTRRRRSRATHCRGDRRYASAFTGDAGRLPQPRSAERVPILAHARRHSRAKSSC